MYLQNLAKDHLKLIKAVEMGAIRIVLVLTQF
jgi:hypothetical protein